MLCKVLGSLAVVALAGFSSAQKLIFNFEKIASDFTPMHSSSTGHVVGQMSAPYTGSLSKVGVWSRANGLVPLQDADNAKIIRKISSSGEVFGLTSDGLVKWNLKGQKQFVYGIPASARMEIFDINDKGEVLLAEPTNSSLVKTYRYATGQLIQVADDPTFKPLRYGAGHSIIGTITNPGGGYGENDRGLLTTLMPNKIYGTAGLSGVYEGDVFFVKDGGYVYREKYRGSSGDYTSYHSTWKSASGEVLGEYGGGYGGGTTFQPATFASGGLAFGTRYGTDTLAYSIQGSYEELDSTNFEVGSLRPKFLEADSFADSGYLLGYAEENGKLVALLGTYTAVPEPLTLAALGLGVAGLARRKRRK